MNYSNLGRWSLYTPVFDENHPAYGIDLSEYKKFYKNAHDEDWYQWTNAPNKPSGCMFVIDDNNVVIYANTHLSGDPLGGRVVLIPSFDPSQVSAQGGRSFNFATGEFYDTPKPIPDISAAQAKIWLRRQGVRQTIEAAVNSAGGEIKDWYDFANVWQYENSSVIQFCNAFGIDRETAFREAALIV